MSNALARTLEDALLGLVGQAKRRALAMEYLEFARTPEEALSVMHRVNADLDDADTLHHLSMNQYVDYVALEAWETGHRDWHPDLSTHAHIPVENDVSGPLRGQHDSTSPKGSSHGGR